MRWTQSEWDAYQRNKLIKDVPSPPAKSKYSNTKVVIDGITFDSKREGSRYVQLKMMEKAGVISELELQPVIELAPAVTIDGKTKRPLTYRGDFRYVENGESVLEDCKGMLTDVYKIKRHLVKALCGLDIRET